ncbi:hypothetical protein GSY74_09130 [Sulfurovum sp. bin170]|uniref:hypothetical protein n=1 Tax=Sulfurovum sp. bin170 TaxID=2695268 RepID=UPI0013E0D1F1|nr:hypothetical protein [Sulfurovum sp. bin170]NEW61443.1 hypothetical protein [Sulfurovum sp. bin170]
MKRKKIERTLLLLSALILLGGCSNPVENADNPIVQEEKKALLTPEEVASKLVDSLKNGDEITSLMSEHIVFIFKSDDRCDGNTKGTVANLASKSIDFPFKIKVTTDGKGWADKVVCKDKKMASTYEMEFELRKKLTDWDRFEGSKYDKTTNSIEIWGGGASDYMRAFLKKETNQNVIYKLEYNIEDPG